MRSCHLCGKVVNGSNRPKFPHTSQRRTALTGKIRGAVLFPNQWAQDCEKPVPSMSAEAIPWERVFLCKSQLITSIAVSGAWLVGHCGNEGRALEPRFQRFAICLATGCIPDPRTSSQCPGELLTRSVCISSVQWLRHRPPGFLATCPWLPLSWKWRLIVNACVAAWAAADAVMPRLVLACGNCVKLHVRKKKVPKYASEVFKKMWSPL